MLVAGVDRAGGSEVALVAKGFHEFEVCGWYWGI